MNLYIRFYGTVQGVGFRATTECFARELSISGTVKNMADGSVEIYAQGPNANVDAFLSRLQNHFKRYLQRVDIRPLEVATPFTDFRIIF